MIARIIITSTLGVHRDWIFWSRPGPGLPGFFPRSPGNPGPGPGLPGLPKKHTNSQKLTIFKQISHNLHQFLLLHICGVSLNSLSGPLYTWTRNSTKEGLNLQY